MATLSSYSSNASFNNMPSSSLTSSIVARNSRLSSLNPIRSSKQLPPPPITNPNPNSHSNNNPHKNSSFNQFGLLTPDDSENFALTRVDTNSSIDSQFSVQSHYKVTLNFSKKEIELVRYTWNKLLLEEPVVTKKSVLPQMPGQFPIETDLHVKHAAGAGNSAAANSASKSLNFVKQTSSTAMASSLFCRQLYGNLLQMEPKLEKMFPSVRHQAVAFAGVMSLAISQLENISNIDDYLTKLGKRHARILCIEAPQFELMGEALIQTFHERFGQRFNQDLEILWIKLYMYLANSMIQFGMDPKLKLNRTDNTGLSRDHLFEHNKLDSDENLPQSDNFSMLGGDPATRSTSYSTSVVSTHGDYFDNRKGSVSTQQTSVLTNQPSMQNIQEGVESTNISAKSGKKKKSRTSIRTKTKENCVIV
ncbi:uncharacterized globin-like protein [[Candida] railenensis]|uniref:Uncharacterized globin-like protein n=1 Tax=[Candida] railenensis TaxID=45579 RepID=A0A9P0QW73_9ASCO|nr:uncharacterized globin-like protein [[Candida] railenensis]